jgi:hypothetical protein
MSTLEYCDVIIYIYIQVDLVCVCKIVFAYVLILCFFRDEITLLNNYLFKNLISIRSRPASYFDRQHRRITPRDTLSSTLHSHITYLCAATGLITVSVNQPLSQLVYNKAVYRKNNERLIVL